MARRQFKIGRISRHDRHVMNQRGREQVTGQAHEALRYAVQR